jgi:hypothetical protein
MHHRLRFYSYVVGLSCWLINVSCSNGGQVAPVTDNGIPFSLSITPLSTFTQLPTLQDAKVFNVNGNWLILGGTQGNFHEFSRDFSNHIAYVFNPNSLTLHSLDLLQTDLNPAIIKQIQSMAVASLASNGVAYLIGGYANELSDNSYTTLAQITSIDLNPLVTAVINANHNINAYFNLRNDFPQFKVTGAALGQIDNDFYLAFGNDCEGIYCTTAQVYTNQIVRFTTNSTLSNLTIESIALNANEASSGFRRRDFSLIPFAVGNSRGLYAAAGPFTPGTPANVWRNGIGIQALNNGISYDLSLVANQQANQYQAPWLSITDDHAAYLITFSGLSALYWHNGALNYDASVPYGNVIDTIKIMPGHSSEWVFPTPLMSPQQEYIGLGANFIPATLSAFDNREVLHINRLTAPTLVGYLYGGLNSTSQEVFNNLNTNQVTNQVYAVYLTPTTPSLASWIQVTNQQPINY